MSKARVFLERKKQIEYDQREIKRIHDAEYTWRPGYTHDVAFKVVQLRGGPGIEVIMWNGEQNKVLCTTLLGNKAYDLGKFLINMFQNGDEDV